MIGRPDDTVEALPYKGRALGFHIVRTVRGIRDPTESTREPSVQKLWVPSAQVTLTELVHGQETGVSVLFGF